MILRTILFSIYILISTDYYSQKLSKIEVEPDPSMRIPHISNDISCKKIKLKKVIIDFPPMDNKYPEVRAKRLCKALKQASKINQKTLSNKDQYGKWNYSVFEIDEKTIHIIGTQIAGASRTKTYIYKK